MHNFRYVSGYRKDHSDFEWDYFNKSLSRVLITYILHMGNLTCFKQHLFFSFCLYTNQ